MFACHVFGQRHLEKLRSAQLQCRIWTSDHRVRWGLQDHPSPCYLCDQEEDTTDHILMQCVYARHVWSNCFLAAHCDASHIPIATDNLEDCWCSTRKRIPKGKRRGFNSMVMITCWSLWKQRNTRVFNNIHLQVSSGALTALIHQDLKLWAFAGGRERAEFYE